MLMHHEGSFHLDDVRHISDDSALRTVLNLKQVPQASTLGGWLRKMGNDPDCLKAWTAVNRVLLKSALHRRKGVTLDIDATEIISHKADAQWTYKKHKGYMPMVGHVAETGQIVACDFRAGNAAPAKENLEFIQQCQQSLPTGCFVQSLRIDAAGYQTNIIKHCDDHAIKYAIRAKMSASLREQLAVLTEADWQPLLNRQGEAIEDQATYPYRTAH